MDKPIDPTTHAALDYGLSAMQILGPDLLGLSARARVVSAALGASYGVTTAVTDTPLGIAPTISFRLHGALEVPFIAAMLGLPWITGACKGPTAKLFFLGCAGMALANFVMTDFESQQESADSYGIEDVSSMAQESLAPLLRT
jgi:hypothetical protein